MAKTVKIPEYMNPFVCEINGKRYSYEAGVTVSVPDEVAALISDIQANLPIELPPEGTVGQIWTKTENGARWRDNQFKQAGAINDSIEAESPTTEEFNDLLEALRVSGILTGK